MLGRLIAIFTFSRRTDCLIGPAKVIDGDTIEVAGQRVRLHGIDAPELDQTSWSRGEQIGCGTMSLAALEALIAGAKVRCEVVERDRHGRLVAKASPLARTEAAAAGVSVVVEHVRARIGHEAVAVRHLHLR